MGLDLTLPTSLPLAQAHREEYTVIYVIGLVLETRPQARPGPDASHASLGLPKQDVVSTLNRQGN